MHRHAVGERLGRPNDWPADSVSAAQTDEWVVWVGLLGDDAVYVRTRPARIPLGMLDNEQLAQKVY